MNLRSLAVLPVALALASAAVPARASDWMDDKPADATPKPKKPADDAPAGPTTMKLGADLALVVPTGLWSDVTGLGIGVLLRFEGKVSDHFAITARAGYIGHFAKETSGLETSTDEAPLIFPGVKAMFGGAYVAAEIGLVRFGTTAVLDPAIFGPGQESSNSEIKFGLSLGVGYEIADVDIRLGLFSPSMEDFSDTLGVMLNVGYNFLKF